MTTALYALTATLAAALVTYITRAAIRGVREAQASLAAIVVSVAGITATWSHLVVAR